MSKIVDDLKRSLARELTTEQKITQAYQAAETDEDREAIRAIAVDELDHAENRDEAVLLLNSVGGGTQEDAEDQAARDDLAYPQISPPTSNEASRVLEALRGLDAQWQAGRIKSRAEYAGRMAELNADLETAEKNDAAARAAYESKVAGTYDYSQRFGEDVPSDGHGSYEPSQHGIRVGVGGTQTDPMRVVVAGDADLTTRINQAGSKAELLDVIRQSKGTSGLVVDDFD